MFNGREKERHGTDQVAMNAIVVTTAAAAAAAEQPASQLANENSRFTSATYLCI